MTDVRERSEPRTRGQWSDGFGRVATRSAQLLLVLAMVSVVTYVAVQLRLVVVPVLIAVLIAAAASPLVRRLARVMPRLLAVWITMLLGLGFLGGAGYLVGVAVASQWGELREGAVQGFQQLQDQLESGPLGLPSYDLTQLGDQLSSLVQGPAVQSGALTGATAVAQVVTGIVLALVVLFYLLADSATIWRFLRAQLPSRTHRRFDLVGQRSSAVLGGYVRGTAIIALVDAVLIGIGLAVVGVPLALPLALLVFIGAFVPLIGAVVAGAVAVLIALVSNGLVAALIVVAIVIGVNQIEGNLLAPQVLGRSLSLHPLVILLALAAGSIVAGIIGAVLAVPFAAVAWAAVQASREADAEPDPTEPSGSDEGPDEGPGEDAGEGPSEGSGDGPDGAARPAPAPAG